MRRVLYEPSMHSKTAFSASYGFDKASGRPVRSSASNGLRVNHPVEDTTRCGCEVIDQLNEALLASSETKVLQTGLVRADTTVVGAGVQRPTDPGWLPKAIGAINMQIGRTETAGAAGRSPWRDALERPVARPCRSAPDCGYTRLRIARRTRRSCSGSLVS